MNTNKIVCLIPVYNETEKIKETIKGLNGLKLIDEVVVINDGSTDNTKEELEKIDGINIISYKKNMGKGYAIKTALKEIHYDLLILLDGDLGETSVEIEKLIEPVLKNVYDFTIAEFPKPKKKGGIGLVKGLAKNGLKFFTGKNIENGISGQRVYKKNVIDTIDYIPNRYGIEVAMTIQALNNGFKVGEIPVNMSHNYTGRNIKGFIHRGKQFKDILFTFIKMYFKGYKQVEKDE